MIISLCYGIMNASQEPKSFMALVSRQCLIQADSLKGLLYIAREPLTDGQLKELKQDVPNGEFAIVVVDPTDTEAWSFNARQKIFETAVVVGAGDREQQIIDAAAQNRADFFARWRYAQRPKAGFCYGCCLK